MMPNNNYSSLANWNRGYEDVSLPAQGGHPPAQPHAPAPVQPPAPLQGADLTHAWPGGMVPAPPHGYTVPANPGPSAYISPPIAPTPRYLPPPYPPPGWIDRAPTPFSRPPTAPPMSPPAEGRGAMVFRDLDGFLNPGPPATPGALPHPAPMEATVPAPGAPPPGAGDDWFRPASPTYNALKTNADLEKIAGFTWGNSVPAGIKEMTPEQAAATTLFKNNMEAFDPTGLLRAAGEFGQSYRPEAGGVAANADLHYMTGGAMYMPAASFRPETSQMIHSHPNDPGHKNDYPSDADHYHAYLATKGNGGNLKGETFYHPGSDKFYWYEPKLEPGAFYPKFYELVNPYAQPPHTGSLEGHRRLPDPSTYGEHFMNWDGPQAPPRT